MECLWLQHKDLFSKRITIKGKKCKEVVENNYNVHIRFRAIKGDTYYAFDNSIIKDEKPSLWEIKLDNSYITKENWDDAKITLELFQPEEE